LLALEGVTLSSLANRLQAKNPYFSIPEGMRRFRLAMTVLCALSTVAGRSRAASVAWRGPDCRASQSRFESRLAAMAAPADLARVSGSASTHVARGRVFLRLDLALADRPLSERSFEAKTCDEAAELAAVVVAMAAAPSGQSAPSPAQPPTDEKATKMALEPRDDRSERRPPRPSPALSDREVQLRLGVRGLLQFGALPSPAWGGSAEFALGIGRRWSVAALASASLAQERALDEKLTRLNVASLILRGCLALLAQNAFRLDGCAGAEGIWTRGEGRGFEVNHSAAFVQAAPHAAADFSFEAPRHVEWHAEIGASLPLTRPRFLAEQREVSRSWPLLLAARFGPFWRF